MSMGARRERPVKAVRERALTAVPRRPIVSCDALRRSSPDVGSVTGEGSEWLLTRSGRSAIALALAAARIGPGDTVLVPNYYCPTMLAPIERAGARPVFYPITTERVPDVAVLERWPDTGRAALLAVHYFGLPVSLAECRAFCDRRGIVLIEDCAHALYGGTPDAPVGGTGDYAIASLPKFLPVLEGGVLASRRVRLPDAGLRRCGVRAEFKAVWNLLEEVAQSGESALASACVRAAGAVRRGAPPQAAPLTGPRPRPAPEDVRREALADPLLAPMALRAVERWIVSRDNARRNIERRRSHYQMLAERIAALGGCRLVEPRLPPTAVPYVLPVEVAAAERVYPALLDAGLPAYRWDRYWPGSAADLAAPMHAWGQSLIQISCHQDLGSAGVEAIVARLAAAIARN